MIKAYAISCLSKQGLIEVEAEHKWIDVYIPALWGETSELSFWGLTERLAEPESLNFLVNVNESAWLKKKQ